VVEVRLWGELIKKGFKHTPLNPGGGGGGGGEKNSSVNSQSQRYNTHPNLIKEKKTEGNRVGGGKKAR